ncbi:hypothetical protein H6P81_005682 [Aristolochia fimbriata]|uniref:Uncharacterized protein n=1 Tax=Aristolochia fimbriata TaxID=158543 RepID=A0AAV7EZP0_ARIFI|nr:hypothetical protein H6P81_005682 [Aristolochia fimbriata]
MGLRLLSCFGRSQKINKSGDNTTVDEASEEQRRCGAVLVELFSSQGCKTSPEAELLLSRLGRGDFNLDVPIIALAFHVDYWDYIGWRDPFASSLWTVRQKAYVESLNLDTLFTPQIIVNGRTHCMGTDEESLLSAIHSATRFALPTMQATFQRPASNSLQVSLTGSLRTKIDSGGADVMVALYESGLMTDCDKGENKGRVLTNDYVVRRMEKLCSVKDISAKKTVSGAVNFELWEDFNPAKCGVVLIIQNGSTHTLGIQQFSLPDPI